MFPMKKETQRKLEIRKVTFASRSFRFPSLYFPISFLFFSRVLLQLIPEAHEGKIKTAIGYLFVLSGLPAKLLLTRFQRYLLFRLPFSHRGSRTCFAIVRCNSHVYLGNTLLLLPMHHIPLCIRLIFSSESLICFFRCFEER